MRRELMRIACVASAVAMVVLLFHPVSVYAKKAEPEKMTYPLQEFTGIALELDAEVHLIQGERFLVEGLCTAPEILNYLDVSIKGSLLVLDCKDKEVRKQIRRVMRKRGLRFNIIMPEVNYVGVRSSGTIVADGPIKAQRLIVELSGSGDCKLTTVSVQDNYSMMLEGSGDLQASDIQVAGNAKIELHGSGDLALNSLDVKGAATIILEGSGDIGVKSLVCAGGKIALSGSGDIEIPDFSSSADVAISAEGSGGIKFDQLKSTGKVQIGKTGSCDVEMQDLVANELNVSQTGSGDVIVKKKGSVQSLSVNVNGSGDFEGLQVQSETATVCMNGSGDVKINTKELVIKGGSASGTLTVKGTPSFRSTGKARITIKSIE